MPEVDYHAWTHRPKARGGTDPGQFAAVFPWLHVRLNLNGSTATDSTDWNPPFNEYRAAPINAGGSVDAVLFGLDPDPPPGDGPWTEVGLLHPGLYRIVFELGWFRDWGDCTIFLDDDHSDGEFSIFRMGGSIFSGAQSYYDVSGAPANQHGLKHEEWWAIDSRATDVFVTPVVSNESGSDRTWNNTDRVGLAALTIFQMSPTGFSSPY